MPPDCAHAHVRRPAPDLIQFWGPDYPAGSVAAISKAAREEKLVEDTVNGDSAQGGLVEAIKQWQRSGQLAAHTCGVLAAHGLRKEGKHCVVVSRTGQQTMELSELLRLLREGGREFGQQDWKGCLLLAVCYVDPAWMANQPGINLVFNNQGKLLVALSQKITVHLTKFLASEKARGSGKLCAQAVFQHISQMAPMSLTVAGQGISTLTSHVRTPGEAVARGLNIADVFANLVAAGEEDQVRQFIQTWPGLLTTGCAGDYSAFSAAVSLQRWNMAALLSDYAHANWEQDLDLLLDLSHTWSDKSPRLIELSVTVFERRCAELLQPAQMPADALHARLVALAVEHMMESMQHMPGARQQAVLVALRRGGKQADSRDPGVGALLAALARAVTVQCALTGDAACTAMRRTLRKELATALATELRNSATV